VNVALKRFAVPKKNGCVFFVTFATAKETFVVGFMDACINIVYSDLNSYKRFQRSARGMNAVK
jgi:hypothetical protein